MPFLKVGGICRIALLQDELDDIRSRCDLLLRAWVGDDRGLEPRLDISIRPLGIDAKCGLDRDEGISDVVVLSRVSRRGRRQIDSVVDDVRSSVERARVVGRNG